MRTWLSFSVLIALALGCVADVGASGPIREGFHRVDAGTSSLYVRTNPHGFVIGTLFGARTEAVQSHATSDAFYALSRDTQAGYAWGYAHGNADRCGWVEAARLGPKQSGNHPRPTCEAPQFSGSGGDSRAYLLRYYASAVNDCQPGPCKGGTPSRVKVTGRNAPYAIFGNYDVRHGLRDAYRSIQITGKTQVAWRYVTKDRKAVLVKIEGGPWGFIARDALPADLPHIK